MDPDYGRLIFFPDFNERGAALAMEGGDSMNELSSILSDLQYSSIEGYPPLTGFFGTIFLVPFVFDGWVATDRKLGLFVDAVDC